MVGNLGGSRQLDQLALKGKKREYDRIDEADLLVLGELLSIVQGK